MQASADIVLLGINARYIHCSFGLRCLQAALGPLQDRSRILEFTLQARPLDMLEKILALEPKILGIGVYIWNARECLELLRLAKRLRPSLSIVIGGPEVSHEYREQDLFREADHTVIGEGEDAFRQLCESILAGRAPAEKAIQGGLPDLASLPLPYSLYSEGDIANRTVYVEASRGCPYRCQFCLSSLDKQVRSVPLEAFLSEMDRLLERGLLQFKFVDRTFNLSPRSSAAILSFFLERMRPGLFLHFEMVPDRFPESLRELVLRFPPGALQFEVGIQTIDPVVATRIGRRLDLERTAANLSFLSGAGVHLHTDLIAGLPGETMESFAKGFDWLRGLGVQEIQTGILKRLRGAPIAKHTGAFGMVYSPAPPYTVLETRDWSFADLAGMRRFARHWDLVGNSGRFPSTLAMLLDGPSPFGLFLDFSGWLHGQAGRTHGISHQRMTGFLLAYLNGVLGIPAETCATALYADHRLATGTANVPSALRGLVQRQAPSPATSAALPARQGRHLA
jgi:radical SAM superfamily enzyme YgiQ (UPF0313 family)